jgi:hypothetical protein
LLEEDNNKQQQKVGPRNTPKPPPIYVTDVTTISPLIQLLEQIAKQQYELKALKATRSKSSQRVLIPTEQL